MTINGLRKHLSMAEEGLKKGESKRLTCKENYSPDGCSNFKSTAYDVNMGFCFLSLQAGVGGLGQFWKKCHWQHYPGQRRISSRKEKFQMCEPTRSGGGKVGSLFSNTEI